MGREHQQAIEANDTALAMLNDDLDESQREYAILSIDMNNWKLEPFRTLKILKKIILIQKNNGDESIYSYMWSTRVCSSKNPK